MQSHDAALVDGTEVPVKQYLDRIDFVGEVRNDHASLEALMRAHLSSVPFENLDVAAGVPVSTDLRVSLAKVVTRRRGGWCFELNGAFCALLRALRFDARLLRARVLLGPPLTDDADHGCIEVKTSGKRWLVDVGFGDAFLVPLDLDATAPQPGGNDAYQLLPADGTGPGAGPTLTRLHPARNGKAALAQPLYRLDDAFNAGHRNLCDVLAVCDAPSRQLQAREEGFFRTSCITTRVIGGGPDRVLVTLDRLKVVRGGVSEERAIDRAERTQLLREWFGIESAPDPPLLVR